MRRLTLFFVAVLAASLLIVVAPAPPPAQAVTENNEILVTNQYGGSTCNLNQQLIVANPFTGAMLRNYGKPSGINFGVFNEAKPFDLNRRIVALWGGSSTASQEAGVGVYDRTTDSWTTGWAFNSTYGIEKGANSPHSITVLPDGYFAVAHVGTMTGVSGSGFVIVFSPTGTKVQQLPLSSAHGVEYDKTRNAVFAVGMSQVKKYTYSTSTHMLTEVTLGAHNLPTSGGHDLRRRRTDSNYFVTTNSGSYIYNPDGGSFQTLTKTSGSAVGGGVKSVDQRFDGVTEYSYYDGDAAAIDKFFFLDRPEVARTFCGNFYKAGRWLYPSGEKVYPEDVPEQQEQTGPKIGFGFPDSHATAARVEGGVKLTYTSNWAVGGDISGVDNAIDKADAEGTIPVIHWYYWGDGITPACVDNYNGPSPDPDKCPTKTREKWNQGATALADLVYSMLQGRPAVITLELEFHKEGLGAYEPLDGYLETQANLLKRPGIKVALGWGEWASDTTYAAYDRAQNASDYAGTQILFSCRRQSLTSIRNATGRVIENANKLEARYGKPVFVYDWAVSSFSEEMSGDPAYDGRTDYQCVTDPSPTGINYETEQNTQVAAIFSRKQELKDAGVIGFVFRALEDHANRNPDGDYHRIAERWFGFRHSGVKKPSWNTVMEGIKAENGTPDPDPEPIPDPTDDWRQEAEEFSTRSVGGQCTDATASGGKCWNIWSNGSISTTTSSLLTSGVKQVSVIAKGDPAADVWPKMVVKVDGITVMDLTVSRDTWGKYSAAITLGTGTHTVEVTFTNDANVNGDDRNLLVDYADIDAATEAWRQEAELFPTKTAGGECITTTGSGGKYWNLWSNGYIETAMNAPYTSQHEVHVAARGRVAGGVWPIMEVSIDGTVVLTQTVNTTTWTSYKIRRTLSGGSHTLRIRFTNDAIIGSEDRNLELDVASLYS